MIRIFKETIILANSSYIWLLAVVAIMTVIFWWRGIKTNRIINLIAPSNNKFKLLLNFSYTKMIVKLFLLSLAALSLGVALLRPQWGTKNEHIKQHGRHVFIALDISRSMLAEDCAGSRLAFAKQKIKKLVNELSSEMVGLVLFSGSAFIQCPLTTDLSAFFLFLDSVDVETIASGATAMEKAITTVLDVYRTMPMNKNRLLVLFTDGEDFSSHLDDVQKQAHEEGLSIFACGIGTQQGAPIPLFDSNGKVVGHQKDKHGNIVISKLNESALQQLVSAIGGRYVRMAYDDTDVFSISHDVSILEKEQFDQLEHSTQIDRYGFFVTLAFWGLLLEWAL